VTRILGIETSCDETAIAIVRDGVSIESNVVASQTDLHARYGGVMPEQASRAHLRAIVPVLDEALAQARADWGDLDAVAVTHGPGLAGALLVGVNVAKGSRLPAVNRFWESITSRATSTRNWLDDVAKPHFLAGFSGGPKMVTHAEPTFPLVALM